MHRVIQAKTEGQVEYIKSIYKNTVTICSGPAGTGKSACAIGVACDHFLRGKVSKIIVARPTVEASKKGIGYIPGSLYSKLEPYVIPAISQLEKFLSKEYYKECFADGSIKFEAIEYMRGMTYDNSFMILEEAQNCTMDQLIMFITRIGENSKIVISGDTDQRDIQNGYECDLQGLIEKIKLYKPDHFKYVQLSDADIVRHPIIANFLKIMSY